MTGNNDKGVLQSIVDNIRNTPHDIMKKRLANAESSVLASNINDIMEKDMSIEVVNTITIHYASDNSSMIMQPNNDTLGRPGHDDVYVKCSDIGGVIPHDDIPAVAEWLLAFHKATSKTNKE